MQECSSWFQSSGFGVVCSPGSVRSSGCAILFRPSVSLSSSWCDTEGRYLQCEFSFRGQSFRVCCLYVPNHNPAWDHFLDDLQAKIDLSVPSLLCGDFNTVFDRALDRRGSDPSDSSPESTSALRGLFDACCMVDIFQVPAPVYTRVHVDQMEQCPCLAHRPCRHSFPVSLFRLGLLRGALSFFRSLRGPGLCHGP